MRTTPDGRGASSLIAARDCPCPRMMKGTCADCPYGVMESEIVALRQAAQIALPYMKQALKGATRGEEIAIREDIDTVRRALGRE